MGVKEKNIINEIQLYFTTIGSRIFRNNTGQGWQGTIASKSQNSITLLNPRPIHSGLATGSSDLIGWTTKIITAEMVGQKVAVFTAIEVKTGSLKATSEQAAFIKAVLDGGGIAKIARSLEEIK